MVPFFEYTYRNGHLSYAWVNKDVNLEYPFGTEYMLDIFDEDAV